MLVAVLIGAVLPLQGLINAPLGHAHRRTDRRRRSCRSWSAPRCSVRTCSPRARRSLLQDSLKLPAWVWAGGVFGAIYVACFTLLVPRIGAAGMICLAVLGQVTASLLLDQFGILQAPKPVDAVRIVGALLGAGGRGRWSSRRGARRRSRQRHSEQPHGDTALRRARSGVRRYSRPGFATRKKPRPQAQPRPLHRVIQHCRRQQRSRRHTPQTRRSRGLRAHSPQCACTTPYIGLCTRYRLNDIAASQRRARQRALTDPAVGCAPANTSIASASDSTGQPMLLPSSPVRSRNSQNASASIATPSNSSDIRALRHARPRLGSIRLPRRQHHPHQQTVEAVPGRVVDVLDEPVALRLQRVEVQPDAGAQRDAAEQDARCTPRQRLSPPMACVPAATRAPGTAGRNAPPRTATTHARTPRCWRSRCRGSRRTTRTSTTAPCPAPRGSRATAGTPPAPPRTPAGSGTRASGRNARNESVSPRANGRSTCDADQEAAEHEEQVDAHPAVALQPVPVLAQGRRR